MIGYKDQKLGNIKVLNVTEARSDFATVLADVASVYVITKNNKPQRVIINYEDFERIKEQITHPAAVDAMPKQESHKAEKKTHKPSIKGLLHEQAHLSRQIEKPVTKESVVMPAEQDEPAEINITCAPPPETMMIPEAEPTEIKTSDDSLLEDYFSTDSSSDIVMEAMPLAPPPSVTEAKRSAAAPQKTAEKVPEPTEEAPMVAPDDDYFQRFRKLYEPTNPKIPKMEQREGTVARTAPAAVAKKPEASPPQKAAPAPASPEPAAAMPATKAVTAKVVNKPEKNKAGDESPSLQDLLKELEEERLSDESEAPLSENQITDLIQRITNDY